MTHAELAAGLGVTSALVGRHARRGMPTTSVAEAQAWREANLAWRRRKDVRFPAPAEAAAGMPASGAGMPASGVGMAAQLMAARLQREQADAETARMRADELAGLLIRRDVVRDAWARRCVSSRETLRGIPDRLAAMVAHETDARKIALLLDEEMNRALTLLAGTAEGNDVVST